MNEKTKQRINESKRTLATIRHLVEKHADHPLVQEKMDIWQRVLDTEGATSYVGFHPSAIQEVESIANRVHSDQLEASGYEMPEPVSAFFQELERTCDIVFGGNPFTHLRFAVNDVAIQALPSEEVLEDPKQLDRMLTVFQAIGATISNRFKVELSLDIAEDYTSWIVTFDISDAPTVTVSEKELPAVSISEEEGQADTGSGEVSAPDSDAEVEYDRLGLDLDEASAKMVEEFAPILEEENARLAVCPLADGGVMLIRKVGERILTEAVGTIVAVDEEELDYTWSIAANLGVQAFQDAESPDGGLAILTQFKDGVYLLFVTEGNVVVLDIYESKDEILFIQGSDE